MTYRSRIFITTILLCHLFLAPRWLISQLLPAPASANGEEKQAQASEAGPESGETVQNATSDGSSTADSTGGGLAIKPGGELVTIKAQNQEKDGDQYRLSGDVEIDFRGYVLKADEMTYDDLSGEITATGNLVFSGGPHDEHITATNGHYNVVTETGTFYNVVGSTGARLKGRGVVLTTSNPFMFTGKEVEQQGRDKIIVRHGRVTSCKLPKPKWTFNAGEVVVVPGENAKIFNSTFRLFSVPIFYFPYVQHPVERIPRQTGFLIPHIGNSTTKGLIIGEGFYWAINRSMDASLGAEYYSRRGWAQRGEYRWRPSETSHVTFNYFGVLDRGTPITQTVFVPGVGNTFITRNPGGVEAQLNAEAELPLGFRGVATIDYLSQFIFRAVYADRFTEAINTEVKSTAFASRNNRGYSFNLMASRYQNFQSTTPGDLITIVHTPQVEVASVDQKLGATPFYYNFDSSLASLSRREPNFVTANVVGRFDVQPSVSLPLHWKGWSFRPELSLRETYYTERLLPSSTGIGEPAANPVNRRALETAFEIRPPSLAKVFTHTVAKHDLKHVIEPHFTYRLVSGVDSFSNILRFDERDVLSDTNEMEYTLVNRLYARRRPRPECEPAKAEGSTPAAPAQPGCEAPAAREIISWELSQKYFFDPEFGGALVAGRRNVFTTSVAFTGIAFLTEPRRFSPIVSRLRMYTGSRFDADWQLDYDTLKGRINASTALVSYHFLKDLAFGGGHAFLQTPGEVLVSQPINAPTKFNQFRLQLNYGSPNRRGLNAATAVGYDARESFLQYSAVQTSYNWDCCGFTFEYRRFNFGNVRDESQYRFALTLANLGTFGTLRKQERLF